MRCSSCEPWLGAFVDDALSPRKRAAVAAHLRSCASCRELYDRLRNVDALLVTGRAAELPANFTRELMGRLHEVPRPVNRRPPLLRLAALYLGCAWIVAALAVWYARDAAAPAVALHALSPLASGLAAIGRVVRSLWPIAPLAASAGVALLAVDALLLAAVILFYRAVHPRVAATLATSSERR